MPDTVIKANIFISYIFGKDIKQILIEIIKIEYIVCNHTRRFGTIWISQKRANVTVRIDCIQIVLHILQISEVLAHIVKFIALCQFVKIRKLRCDGDHNRTHFKILNIRCNSEFLREIQIIDFLYTIGPESQAVVKPRYARKGDDLVAAV